MLINSRLCPIDLVANSRILESFSMGLIDQNLKLIDGLLDEEGVFYGRKKTFFLAKLNSCFHEMKCRDYFICINKGISTGNLPGAELIEVRFIPDDSPEAFDFSKTKKLGEPAEDGEVVFRFSAQFKEGKIYKLVSPQEWLNCEAIESRMRFN